MNGGEGPVLVGRGLTKTFHPKGGDAVRALGGVDVEVARGSLTALVGPDGAGKTTLLRLACGLLRPDDGELEVVGLDVTERPEEVQSRLGYMPQRFGLYDDLSVQENLDLYADLHGVIGAARERQYERLLEMTALRRFVDRPAGKLSGGMKQKLGLACTLVREPELLLLDEPTAGVDPLSRRELWEIVDGLRAEGLTVLVSTSYLDEAERCDRVFVLREGQLLAAGVPSEVTKLAAGRTFRAEPSEREGARVLQARLLDDPAIVDAVPEGGHVRFVTGEERTNRVTGASPARERFEDGFMVLVHRAAGERDDAAHTTLEHPPETEDREPVVEVRDLVKKFGDFTAVDHVSFEVARGEVYGLLGPNGAGKTTTFRMLCGLIPPSGGSLRVAGVEARDAPASLRRRIGYVAQKFSLYERLTVRENLTFFGSAYGLRGRGLRERIDWAIERFGLGNQLRLPSGQMPGGHKRRLALAAALLHEPEILFLDEPTSGADPLARREFWRRITALADQRVTIIVTTHFMEEAEYCDRVAILDQGTVLAEGTPAEIRGRARTEGEPTMEDAFVAIVEESRARTSERSSV